MAKPRGNPALIAVQSGHLEGKDRRRLSHGTQAAFASFKRDLDRRLQAEGIHGLKPRNFGQRHMMLAFNQVLGEVKVEKRAVASAKNWTSNARKFCRAIGKGNLLPRTNRELGLERRGYRPMKNKAFDLQTHHLDRVTCPYVAAALELQKEFGWRREAAIKFRADFVKDDGTIELPGPVNKGGRPLTVEMRTDGQRAAVERASELCGTTPEGSLIPTRTYKQQTSRFEYQCRKAGLSGSHGLRHAYAQNRYKELTGWECPLRGGPLKVKMTTKQQAADRAARNQISREMGHGRRSIVTTYIGSASGKVDDDCGEVPAEG